MNFQGPAGKIHFVDYGSGTPMVFLHSFGANISQWDEQLNEFKKSHRAIALDFRGHGESEKAKDGNYSAEALASDIDSMIKHLNLEPAILVGHSMGGAASIAYLGKHAENVRGLVLAGTPGKSDQKQASQVIQALESDKYEQVMDQYMERLLVNGKPEIKERIQTDRRKIDKQTSISIIKAMFDFDPLPIIEKYNGPALIISTELESNQPNALHQQAKKINTRTVKGTSHWINMDKPEEFNAILREFIQSVENPGK